MASYKVKVVIYVLAKGCFLIKKKTLKEVNRKCCSQPFLERLW